MKELSSTRVIPLSDGNNLIISYNEQFYDKVRKHLGLDATQVPTDEHIKVFFVEAVGQSVA